MWVIPYDICESMLEAMTFDMPPWHVGKDPEVNKLKAKEALQSQSLIAAFKACNMLQALGIAYSKIVSSKW